MARKHDIITIHKLTGVGKRTVERLMSDYRKYGTAARLRSQSSLKGRKRKLSTKNVEVSKGHIWGQDVSQM
jgi:transposase